MNIEKESSNSLSNKQNLTIIDNSIKKFSKSFVKSSIFLKLKIQNVIIIKQLVEKMIEDNISILNEKEEEENSTNAILNRIKPVLEATKEEIEELKTKLTYKKDEYKEIEADFIKEKNFCEEIDNNIKETAESYINSQQILKYIENNIQQMQEKEEKVIALRQGGEDPPDAETHPDSLRISFCVPDLHVQQFLLCLEGHRQI